MSLLRILHVVPYFEDAWAYGGIPRVASALTRGLARRGHHVTVYTTDACDAVMRARQPGRCSPAPRLEVHAFPNISNRLAYHFQAFVPRGLFRSLRRTVPTFDVAHVHACRNIPGSVAAHELSRAGVPYVLSPHGTAPAIERRILLKRLFDAAGGRRVVLGAHRVLATTEAERQQLILTGVAPDRITVVPNPLDIAEFGDIPARRLFRAAYDLGDGPVVLFLGKLTPRKGLDVLIRAASILRHSSAAIVIAGNDMGAGAQSSELAADVGVSSRIRRVGLLRGRERLEALASADVVVYPSRHEVFGLVPLEALLCGTPVVVSNDSGCGEIIGRTGGGHIVPYGDVPTLAGAIDSILDSPDVWRRRAASAAVRVRDLFDAEAVCEQVEQLYQAVAATRGHAGNRA